MAGIRKTLPAFKKYNIRLPHCRLAAALEREAYDLVGIFLKEPS